MEIPAERRQNLVRRHELPEPVFVTRPTMPRLEDYTRLLEEIWERKWLTNNGVIHQRLERRLAEMLGVEHLCLTGNGTLALLLALQALDVTEGEVITTPFTFPATVHAITWNRTTPVFCDVDPRTYNLDPERLESLINESTRAILPVHVYGQPCDVESIQEIARAHGLHVIYDAAHAFAVRYKDRSILEYGDAATLSFHATKLFSTAEGGAVVVKTADQRVRTEFFRNFGIADQETVIGPGINAKMSELQAAYGILQIELVGEEITRRREITVKYHEALAATPGITCPPEVPDTEHNHAYYPILIDEKDYGFDRDQVHGLLKQANIMARKYFHPLCSTYAVYRHHPSASPERLPVAERIASQVLCLPMYGTLDETVPETIGSLLHELHQLA